ncbi:glycoside hydrolase family 75 protein [Streptomyces sp. NPDC059009]|uniref:glycoside hydrolase family 75 protein n=1 Tax=Streptomyces sp. NPDC059009 TaxID=3346694 RepID=UPI0036D1F469
MRTRTVALAAAAGAALLAPATMPAAARPADEPAAHPADEPVRPALEAPREPNSRMAKEGSASRIAKEGSASRIAKEGSASRTAKEGSASPTVKEGSVRAADLLARLRSCRQISHGKYRTDDGARASVPVCGGRGAVFWKADMDIDCDGRPSRACNHRTDPLFAPMTAFQQSNGDHLSAERLPYVVVPGASSRWNPAAHGIKGGGVAAVIYRGKVAYAVVGDTGPTDLIGEASYATARALGIPPNPRTGGAGPEVTYLLFKNSRVSPVESHRAAVARGDALARRFLGEN